MDLSSDLAHVPRHLILVRAGRFFAWIIGFIGSMSVIGLIPTVPIFVTAFMRVENREPWKLVLPQAIILPIFIYVLFDRLLTIPWPPTFISDWFPAIRALNIPSV